MDNPLEDKIPLFYGATTVGERGQVVIPAEARRELNLTHTTKLLVFGSPDKGGLILTKAEYVSEFLARAVDVLTKIEKTLQIDKQTPSK